MIKNDYFGTYIYMPIFEDKNDSFNINDADSSVCFGVGSFVAKMKQFLLLSKF